MKLLFPWKMYGEYEDSFEVMVNGFDDEDCMTKLINLIDKHGNLVYYTGVCDEDYVGGEYIGRDNFIYD